MQVDAIAIVSRELWLRGVVTLKHRDNGHVTSMPVISKRAKVGEAELIGPYDSHWRPLAE